VAEGTASAPLAGKNAFVFGIANRRSIAWGIAQALAERGARLALAYQGDRFRGAIEELVAPYPDPVLVSCDVLEDDQLDAAFESVREKMGGLDYVVHSVAAAKREELTGSFRDTSRDGYRFALEVSAFSFVALAKRAAPLMEGRNGSMLTLSYIAAERAVPSYNVMGSAKAALEHAVRQLALEMGPLGVRVNCISAGPLNTLAARGITGFTDMLKHHEEIAPLRRNTTLDDIAGAAYFLLSDLGSGVTGETLHVDCGYHILSA
jgi:enoyl-[acyl-carrier protein] reductase I